ncbi:MAG TPA: alkaline phosphatase family protein [Candidatus Limnocylindria bacterium]|nr:alkaline phosphatase family protein [Candidatus Limnocylindria bacterium]
MKRTAVINVVGLTESLIGEHTPFIKTFRERNKLAHITPAFPAVTCTAQSDYVTGTRANDHGIVANGWYNRELAEVQFWKQSNHLVQRPKIWDELKRLDPSFTCAKLFWWYNMYSTADFSITPRPMYPADGRKVFDIYTHPPSLRYDIKAKLGEFPFQAFWGPAAGIDTPQATRDAVSHWIAESAKWIERRHMPTLSLIYLPHLDYNLQRLGPSDPAISRDLRDIDGIVGNLIECFEERDVQVILLSEYGITPVNHAIHLNRLFREENWIVVREELGRELLDCGASKVFAVADHQVAHIYIRDQSLTAAVRKLVAKTSGIATVLGEKEKREAGIDHSRAGDLIAVAEETAWFTYYYWLDDAVAPDFARTVDIHRKPGYDPVDLFLDPAIKNPKVKIAWRLLQKKLGFRMLMDLIPLDASLVKGSHGCRPRARKDWPVLIAAPDLVPAEMGSMDVYHVMRRAVLK